MGDSVEVIPRFKEPVQPTSDASSMTRGLFTSMYENKMIVLFIVVVIISIAIIAYIVCKKTDADPPKPAAKGGPAPPAAAPAAPAAPVDLVPSQPSQPSQPAPITDKNDLRALLARSKTINKPVQVSPSAKSEAEILQLMEDAETTNLTDDNNDNDNNDNENKDEVSEVNTDSEQPSSADMSKCSVTLPIGRQCMNKATHNGKCGRHQGK